MRKQHLCIAIFALLVFTLCLFVACEKEGVSCDHSFEYIQGKEPTCEEIGWKDYKRCNSCGYSARLLSESILATELPLLTAQRFPDVLRSRE